jgi:AraC-like DNA-binding protein
MSPRTLKRRLETQGTSFHRIATEVRMEVALKYLRETSIPTDEIAARIGYSDAANFRHAFKRWTGKTPAEARTTSEGLPY